MAKKMLDKIGYNFACVKDFCEIVAPIGGSGMGHQWAANRILPRLTPVAMATKFVTKLAITLFA